MKKTVLILSVLLLSSCINNQTIAEPDQATVEWVCTQHPQRITNLFNALDLSYPGLQKVATAVEKQNYPKACKELLKYYEKSDSGNWLRKQLPQPSNEPIAEAEEILNDIITAYLVPDRVPRLENGGLDWSHNGPENDKEWGWFLNRHFHIKTLLDAYFKTGNKAYSRRIDEHIRDWITSSPYPGKPSNTPQWRGLEVYLRLIHWSELFYALQNSEEFSPAARILMLSSIGEHAHYNRNFHATGGNWITMEMNGLTTAAVCWPEFKDSQDWLDHAIEQMTNQINIQVYPDGVQKELTSHYHRVALEKGFQPFADKVNYSKRQLRPEFKTSLEKMWNYLAYIMRPDGHSLLNNDSDRDFNRDRILKYAEIFNRPDWAWIASNGTEGKAPTGQPSVVFPWAGQLIMRNGYDGDAHWAFFDVGPLGTGHYNFDKLHLSVAAFGRDLLVDSGRYTYRNCAGRAHVAGTAAHNTILIDGKGQKANELQAASPMKDNYKITDKYDYARGTFDSGYNNIEGVASHTRAVVYLRDNYWIVVDRVNTDRPRNIQTLWHWHPECTVETDGLSSVSVDPGKGNLRIVPVGEPNWNLEQVKGRREPNWQGWYSREYNHFVPTTASVYSAEIKQSSTFAWLLIPGKDKVPAATAKILSSDQNKITIEITTADQTTTQLTIPLKGRPDMQYSTRVPIAKGWAKNSVNATIFRTNSVITHGDDQYVSFYDETGSVILAKRKLDTAEWQIRKTQYTGNVKDAHNGISIAVDGTGILHMAWDHHGHKLNYCQSTAPGSLELTDKMPMTGLFENGVTYPEFFNLPDGGLLFMYRDGSSGNGQTMLNRYDLKTRKWQTVRHNLIDGQGQRNAYTNQIAIDKEGTWHISWCWREAGDVATNHDICYAKSTDGGRIWQKSTGEKYDLPITAENAEYACNIPQKSELMNQCSMTVDPDGSPLIAQYWRPEGTKVPQYQLVWHDGQKWRLSQIGTRRTPFTLAGAGTKRVPISRPKVLADNSGRVYVIFRDSERSDRVSVAVSQHRPYEDWQTTDLTFDPVNLWEPTYDTTLWQQKNKLHIFLQKVAQGDAETLKETTPQTVSILEWLPPQNQK